MRCSYFRKKLTAYLDDELSETARGEIDSHLNACTDCHSALARLKNLTPLLRQTPAPEIPQNLVERVISQAREHLDIQSKNRLQASISSRLSAGPVLSRIAAAAVLVFGLTLGTYMGRNTWTGLSQPSIAHLTTTQAEPAEIYRLDFLSHAPQGSLQEAFLTMTQPPNEQRK